MLGTLTARRTKREIKNYRCIKDSISTDLSPQLVARMAQGMVFRAIPRDLGWNKGSPLERSLITGHLVRTHSGRFDYAHLVEWPFYLLCSYVSA